MQTFLEQRLEEHPERLKCINHYIFTDSDIAVVGNLGHIFKKYHDFHLALTFRNNKDQPLNSGFIAVKGTSDGILRNTTLSYFRRRRELNTPLILLPSSDSALDSMCPIMSGNRSGLTLEVAWRRTLLHEIASALVEVIFSIAVNTSVVFELVIYEQVCRLNPIDDVWMPRMIPLTTLSNVSFDIITSANVVMKRSHSEEVGSLAIRESFDLAHQNVVALKPVPKILS
ncbi:hypothetical protein J5N97_006362 [Dioscorea zingiberensis]|uniref:Uncharacterized protein n=1 Tax=Dioscorea zingiberensis TaxID=325984 RepID=A0A9D5HTK0_9LILI|nr:hypothetical protein J5N97_006362 [Dioscorea zingiberensis]